MHNRVPDPLLVSLLEEKPSAKEMFLRFGVEENLNLNIKEQQNV